MKHRAGRRKRAHHGVKVLRLGDGRHVARYVDPLTGRQQQESLDRLGLTNDVTRRAWAREKSDELAQLRRAVSLGTAVAKRTGIREAIQTYLDAIAHEPTRISKSPPLFAFADRLEASGTVELADLTAPVLLAWRDWCCSAKREHEASTKNRWTAAVATFLRWALRRGMTPLLTGDAIGHAAERLPELYEAPVFLAPDAIRKLLDAALQLDVEGEGVRAVAPFVLGLLLSGARFDELAGATWGEIHTDGIHLPAARVKTRRARTITFAESPALYRLLEALRPKNAKDDDPVFRPAWTASAWQDVPDRLVRHGAPGFTAHGLRRTCGTILTNAPGIHGGASAWHSAKRLGHSVEQSERDYAGRLTGLLATATTIEKAVGIEAIIERIIEAAERPLPARSRTVLPAIAAGIA